MALRILLGLAAVLGLTAVFLALLVVTDGAGRGLPAWLVTLGLGILLWRRRLLPVVIAAALTATVLIPTAPTERRYPAELSFVATQHWDLPTGSRVAVYHYPASGVRRPVPLVYLNGGPVRSMAVLDHRFLQLLAGQGYDVYAYEQAGGGRSELLPMDRYSISRSVRDLAAVAGRVSRGKVDVLGFSAGAVVLTQALADPQAAAHFRRAIIAEPGPMDGPTAHLAGHPGSPSARGLVPAPTGSRSTHLPRYAVAFGLMRLGLLSPGTGLLGQAEGVNAFTAADLGSDTASAYCARDAHRIPIEDTEANFSFNAAASLRIQQTIKDSPSIAQQLSRSTVPTMLMIAECSSQLREWATAVLAADPAIQRTQYLPGVGHHLWNGLDNNNPRAAATITTFLDEKPPPSTG
ncbi:alpha/beta hydrolase [Kribbella sp. NBC_01505]|uniref:alpha/beta hydrolase n=1 Tax=Kribbella sp. NBC_01505 TaxID=2903580 RepID=UPI00386944FB